MSIVFLPLGTEFLVNTETGGSQTEPTITGLANDGFVVSWTVRVNTPGEASKYSVNAQLFAADGAKVGAQFLINTLTADRAEQPTITGLVNGGFVVSWANGVFSPEGELNSIKAQLFAADGAKVGAEFIVNTQVMGAKYQPTVIGLANGDFVVSWYDFDRDGTVGDASDASIKAQLFSAGGSKIGTEFLVNTQTADGQFDPTITGLASGGFVVSWYDVSSILGDTNFADIKAQLFSANGAKVGTEFLVNTQTKLPQVEPTITELANGGFVVSWMDESGTIGDASVSSIKAQIFAATGSKIGTEFLVNTQTEYGQVEPVITGLADGGFVVTWRDGAGPLGNGIGASIKAQLFAVDGARVGTEFRVNAQADVGQFDPTITALANGGFVVSWTDGSSIKAQIYVPNEAPTNLLVTPGTLVVENTAIPAGTVRTTFTYRDDAVGTETVTLSGTDAALFEVVGNQVRWLAATTPDFEAKARYEFTINVDDPTLGTGPELSQLVTINVTDVLETGGFTPGNDIVTLPAGSPPVNALAGNDTIIVNAASPQRVDGGVGLDHFVLSGVRSSDAQVYRTNGSDPASQVYRLYDGILGRDPDPIGFAYWVGQIDQGRQLTSVASEMLASTEGAPRWVAGVTDAQFATLAYSNILGRPPTTLEASTLTADLAGGLARGAALARLTESAEETDGGRLDAVVISGLGRHELSNVERVVFSDGIVSLDIDSNQSTGTVARLFDMAFDREGDRTGVTYWTREVDGGRTAVDIAGAFLASPEGASLAGLSNSDFVTALYNRGLDRAPDAGGLAYWTGRVATEGRAIVLAEMSESPEHVGIVDNRIDAPLPLLDRYLVPGV